MAREQLPLPFGPLRNRNFLSNHWLEHRLVLEPEWDERRAEAERLFRELKQLWAQQAKRVEHYAEATLEQAFIQPILTSLGWTFQYQTFLRGREPDYAFFMNETEYDAALKSGRREAEFWTHACMVGDAKAWKVNLDVPTRSGNNQREYPPEQIEWYMDHACCDYAILTNGRLWRFYPRALASHQPRFETYLEFDLKLLLETWEEAGDAKGQRTIQQDTALVDSVLKFYLFFSPAAFESIDGRKPLIQRAVEGSNEYRVGVGEGLKDRVFEALRICMEGFLSHRPNNLNSETDLWLCKEQSLILLYRLLFIMYAEDRELLPYRANRTYRENRSLARLRDLVAARLTSVERGRNSEFDLAEQGLWDDLGLLFDLIDHGGKRYGVPAYNGGLFDPEENVFLNDNVLPDRYLALVIDQLGRAPDAEHPDAGLFRVDYRDLSIQHLGHVYEGLLELHPRRATEPMAVIRKKNHQRTQEKVIPCSQTIPSGFEYAGIRYETSEVFLVNDKGERRATGSYYTPDNIVDHIIRQTLSPLCNEISRNLTTEIADTEAKFKCARGRNRELFAETLRELRNDFANRILHLKVLDPAMGSGHFLLRACQHLAEEIATNPNAGDPGGERLQSDESTLSFWKRRVVEHCLYGVDLNPLAVELAKVALWLETAAVNHPLTFLDHHLRCGNSLVGATVGMLGSLPGAEALPLFEQQVSSRLPAVLEGLKLIVDKPSDTVEQVKEKVKIFRSVVDAIRRPFIAVADLWCAMYFLDRTDQIAPHQYAKALQTIGVQNRHARVRREGWFQKALEVAHRPDVSCFHWELEFPEVFFDKTGQHEGAGFDVVMGNPPWGHAHSLEILKRMAPYDSVNDDHSECFVCQATALVRRGGGRVGLVLPDTILSPAKRAIRRHMLQQTKTEGMMNIGPDWFTTDVRMSSVIWTAIRPPNPPGHYHFRSCVFPIKVRRATQAGTVGLDDAVRESERTADVAECLGDADVAIPLFGDNDAVVLLTRTTVNAPTLEQVCDHGRGVELNKCGHVIRCPACGLWDAPSLKDEQGRFQPKKCAHCGHNYALPDGFVGRTLVASEPQHGTAWKPYIDGDSIARYVSPSIRWIDTSAQGINYKAEALYASPKILIRQAGIGANAILDHNLNAYCPQSVYVYRVKPHYRQEGLDESILVSFLCSRLFHLQVFMSFGEIDSSRAFSKLTHTRLARMRTVLPSVAREHPAIMSYLRNCITTLCSTKNVLAEVQHMDWGIEGCWSHLFGLTVRDVYCVVRNFSKVHHNETMEALFPGGLDQNKDRWVAAWLEAIERARELDSAT